MNKYPNLKSDNDFLVWLQIEPMGDNANLGVNELTIVRGDNWFNHELDNFGYEMLLNMDNYPWSLREIWDYEYNVERFALFNGLYLFQPFLVLFKEPHCYKCNHPLEPEEWDVEFYFDIIYREPVNDIMHQETTTYFSKLAPIIERQR